MAKKERSKRGFTFEQKIDLSSWDFNHLDSNLYEAQQKMIERTEKSIEKHLNKYIKDVGSIDGNIRKIASQALQITFEKEISAYFLDLDSNPELITIGMSDFAEDGYTVKININEIVEDAIKDRCDYDGYVHDECAEGVLNLSKMLEKLAEYARTAVRPKE